MTSRLLVAVGLLAVVTACKSPPAGDGVRPDEPTTAAVEAADAGAVPTDGTDGQDPAAPPAVPPLVQEMPLLEMVGEVRDRVDRVVAEAQRDLAALQAAHDAARDNARAVFERLDALHREVERLELPGAAGELDAMLDEARTLDLQSQGLLDDIAEGVAGVERFAAHADAVLADALEVAQELQAGDAPADPEVGPTAETLQRASLWDLDAEAAALQAGLLLPALDGRADGLVAAVGLLSARLDESGRRLEGKLAAAARKEQKQAGQQGGATGADGLPVAQADTGLAAGQTTKKGKGGQAERDPGEIAEIVTNHGTLLVEFFPDVAPRHVENFKKLAREGFYDGLGFHRVLPGYLVQGGCPLGTGLGGPGYQLEAEFNERAHRRGTVSMARQAHPDTAGSQFFVCLSDRPELDGKQTVFGRVIRGEATLAALESLGSVSGDPTEPIEIESVLLRAWQRGDNEKSLVAGNPVD